MPEGGESRGHPLKLEHVSDDCEVLAERSLCLLRVQEVALLEVRANARPNEYE